MKPFIEQAQHYAAYQQNVLTRYIHMVGIPLIILSIMILLGFVRVVIYNLLNVSFAEIATLGILIYYYRIHWRLALALTPILVLLVWIAEYISHQGPTSFALSAFILALLFGCVLQLIGYFLEGKRPPINSMLELLLIAPLALVADLFFMVGRMGALKGEIYGNNPLGTHGDTH